MELPNLWIEWENKARMLLRGKSPLSIAIWVSVLIHVVLITIHFEPELKKFRDQMPALEVMLVNAKTKDPAEKADVLAQANLDRGGNTDQNRKMKTAMPTPKQQLPQVQMQSNLDMRSAAQAAQTQSELEQQQQHVAELERKAQAMMTQLRSSNKLDTLSAQKAKSAQPEVGKQALKTPTQKNQNDVTESIREMERLEALIAKQQDAYEKRPKRQFIGARAKEYRFAMYVESWRQKVEGIGNLNYPQAAKVKKIYGKLQMTVNIKADGTIEDIRINQSSGHKVLDEAAKRIVQIAAPFDRFPPEIKKDTDILSITRTWTFTQQDALSTE